jgi:hypothetical protein
MYSGFAEKYAAYGLTCDPLSAEDIAAKIVQLCDAGMYAELSHRIAVLPLTRTYTQVADDFLALFTSASYRV